MQDASKPLPTIDGFVTQLLDGLDVSSADVDRPLPKSLRKDSP